MRYQIPPDEVQELADLIERTARFVASDFPGVDADDVAQDVWVEVCNLKKKLDLDNPYIGKQLRRRAVKAAWAQRAKHLEATCQYTYRPSDVKRILETTFDQDDWIRSYVPDDAKSWSLDALDAADVRIDIFSAFLRLPETYRIALLDRYREGVLPDSYAERKRFTRAIERMVNLLNSHYRLPGEK